MAQSRIFPILLDGDQENVTATTHTWNGTTSVIRVDSTSTITVGDGSVEGTLLNIMCKTADDVVVNISTDPYGSNNLDSITLTNIGDVCTLMWTGSKWNNIKLRKAAKARDLKLSQHGLFDQDGNNLAAGKSEEQVFELLGFDYVEPQKR